MKFYSYAKDFCVTIWNKIAKSFINLSKNIKNILIIDSDVYKYEYETDGNDEYDNIIKNAGSNPVKTEGKKMTKSDRNLPIGVSPKCESGYGTSFGSALSMLKAGKKVARKGWNGKGMFIFLVPGSKFKVNRAPLLGIYEEGTEIEYQPHIDMKTADNTVVPWLASQSDILAEDYYVVD